MDLVCNATITEVMGCFENHPICTEMLNDCKSMKYVYKRGEANALV